MKTKILKRALSLFFLTFFLTLSVNAALNINVLEPVSDGQYFINSIGILNITSTQTSNCSYNINLGTNFSFSTSNLTSHTQTNLNISSFSQGLNTINILCIKSDNSSISNSTTRTFIRDNTSPITSNNAPFGWRTNPFNITLTPIDTYSGVFQTYYNINFGAWTNGTTIPISTTGTHFVSYYSVDNLNQTEASVNLSVSLDINKPITLDNAPAFGWYNTPYNVTLNSSDIGSGTSFTSYRFNGGNWTNGSIVPIIIEGNNSLDYFSVDIAGNIENIKTVNVGLDINTPNTSDDNPNTWQNNFFNINLNSSDIGSGVSFTSYRLNNGTWINATTIPITIEGNNSLEYYSVDIAGNTESTKLISALLDFTAPITNDNSPSGWQSTPFNITLNASDNLSQINQSFYRINGGNWTNGSFIMIFSSGNYSIDYYSQDYAGNSNNISNINVVLDFTAPVTNDNAPVGWQKTPFNITLNASDLGSGINRTYYRINFGAWKNNTNMPFTNIPITNSGIYSIDYYSVDLAGYVEPTNSFSVHLDMELPVSYDNAPNGWQTSPFNITLSGNDSYSNIDYISHRIDGGNWSNSTTILINNSGNFSLEYYSVDLAGNIESPKTTNILLDTYLENITYNISSDWQISPYNITLNISDNVSGIDFVSYRLNGGNWTNSSFINANESGYFNVEYYAADKAGNTLPVNNFSIKLDLDLPYTSDTAPIGWQKTPFNILLISSDDTSGVIYTSYKIDNSSWINGTLFAINTVGNHSIQYFAKDLAGNTGIIKTVNVSLDNLAPTTLDDAPLTSWHMDALNISLSAFDNHTGINYTSYRIDGGNWTNGTTVILNSSGNHSFQYFSVDNIGNIETVNTKYISLDFDKPITTDDAPLGWQSTPFIITLSASDNSSGVINTSYRINGGNWTNGTIIFVNTPGNYSIDYFSQDLAGNNESIKSISVGLDITKPSTTDDAPLGWQLNPFNITLNATDDAAVAYTNYRINGGNWTSGTTIIINSSGNFTINYHSVDNIGNIETVKNISVALDLTIPTMSDNSPNGWQLNPFNITLTANDTYSGIDYITYRINGGNWTNGTTIYINSSANHTIEYFATDKASNIASPKNISAAFDMSEPTTIDNSPLGWQTSEFNIYLNASDLGIGVANTSYRINSGNWTLGNTILIDNTGTYFIEYYSVDLLGNIESIKNTSAQLDLNSSKITSINVLSPVTYNLNKAYTFNLSLDTNVGVSNLSLNFEGTSYPLNNINNSVNYYYILNNLSAGSYSYNFEINTLSNISIKSLNNTLVILSLDNNTIIAENQSLHITTNISKIIIPKFSPIELINISLNSSLNLSESMNFYLNLSNLGNQIQSNLTKALRLIRNENASIYEIEFSSNTSFESNPNWDNLFEVIKSSKLNYTVDSGEVNLVLSMGSQNNRINLSKAAKIRIPAMAGKSTAWSLNSSSLTKITTICNSISNPSNIDPVSVQECYIDDGLDLLIWTFHFTDFAAYTPDPVVTPPPDDDDDDDDNSGSSGSSSSSSTTNSVIYYVDEEENENENDTILETSLENSIENEKKYITWPRIDYQKLNTSNDFLEFNYLNMDNTLKLKGILYSSKILTMTFKDRSEEVFTLNEGTNLLLDSNNNGENDLKVWFKFVDSKNVRVYMSPLFKNVDEELALINLNKASEELSENNQNMEKLNSIEETSNIQTTSENTDTSETKTENMEEEKTSWGVYVLTSILILIILYFPITYIRWRIYLKGEETNEIDLDTPQTVNHLKKHIVNHVIDEVIINKNLQNKDNHPMDKYIKKRSEQIEELNLNDSDYIDDYSDK